MVRLLAARSERADSLQALHRAGDAVVAAAEVLAGMAPRDKAAILDRVAEGNNLILAADWEEPHYRRTMEATPGSKAATAAFRSALDRLAKAGQRAARNTHDMPLSPRAASRLRRLRERLVEVAAWVPEGDPDRTPPHLVIECDALDPREFVRRDGMHNPPRSAALRAADDAETERRNSALASRRPRTGSGPAPARPYRSPSPAA